MMNRDDALAIVREYVKNENLINHMLSVEAVMRFYAGVLEQPVDLWGNTGLLHDFDWEIHPTAAEHPACGAALLRQKQVPEEIVQAILAHGNHLGIPRVTLLEKGLYACDEITGLVTAVALVRPSRSLFDLETASVRKKWKDRAFAAGADREEIARGAEEFGLPLWEHCDNVIIAMRSIAAQIGLDGKVTPA